MTASETRKKILPKPLSLKLPFHLENWKASAQVKVLSKNEISDHFTGIILVMALSH